MHALVAATYDRVSEGLAALEALGGAGGAAAVGLSEALDGLLQLAEVLHPPQLTRSGWQGKGKYEPSVAARAVLAAQHVTPANFGGLTRDIVRLVLSPALAASVEAAGLELPTRDTLYRWRTRLDMTDCLYQRLVNQSVEFVRWWGMDASNQLKKEILILVEERLARGELLAFRDLQDLYARANGGGLALGALSRKS